MRTPRLTTDGAVGKVLRSLAEAGVEAELFTDVQVEPTRASMERAVGWMRGLGGRKRVGAVIAVGGGSAMDTAKVANLLSALPEADFHDHVNAPIGKGKPVPRGASLLPLVAIPTTSGTGSEATGVAIYDEGAPTYAKTGFADRRLRPTLGIVDPECCDTMPRGVRVASGFDTLCHALESYTALPYHERTPRPATPDQRPAYQGANPVSDVWAVKALEIVREHFVRSVEDPDAKESRDAMALASAMAGVGFGSAGVHLCHGMSYPISGLRKPERALPGYTAKIVPHGVAVTTTAPAVFRFTAPACPERHAHAAELLTGRGVVSGGDASIAGGAVGDAVLELMQTLSLPLGLEALGYGSGDVDALVDGALPQRRVLQLAPRRTEHDELASIYEAALRY